MPGRAETVSLAPVFVTSSRGAEAADTVPFSHETLTAEAVRRAPAVTLDGALRGIPGFSLFRRTDSLVANPTTQGVSLRGLGPSGASRSLVLLDGVPYEAKWWTQGDSPEAASSDPDNSPWAALTTDQIQKILDGTDSATPTDGPTTTPTGTATPTP